jgi:hypothetical protein
MALMRVFSPPSTNSEDTFLSGDCQLYFSTGSLAALAPTESWPVA